MPDYVTSPYVIFPEKVGKNDVKQVGGKAANLAEMFNAGFPVPEHFFVTVDAYNEFINVSNIKDNIHQLLSVINFSDISSIKAGCESIRNLIMSAKMPDKMRSSICAAYRSLAVSSELKNITSIDMIKLGRELPFVAVRSSAVVEDIAKASSAGQYETLLNIKGEEELIDAIKHVWASLYTDRATYYRYKNQQPLETAIGVIVQRMVNAEKSGVTFTVDPVKPIEAANKIFIEACWGLGETIVQGQVEPDAYYVDKTTGLILEKRIGKKLIQRKRDQTGKTVIVDVPQEKQNIQVLSDEKIIELAAHCKNIETHYNYPQDIEWCTEQERIYIVQTRAVTTLKQAEKHGEITGTALVSGLGASPGIASGTARIIHDLNELNRIQKGDILVTVMTSPDMVPAMEKAAAIVTDQGGSSCHAAIVSRELGIPCIVGTKNATQIIKEGQELIVDATRGMVYEKGSVQEPLGVQPLFNLPLITEASQPSSTISIPIITATDIKVNLAFAEHAEQAAAKSDGVGLLRLEHLLTKSGMHPFEYVRQGRTYELEDILYNEIEKIARAFYPKPVWVRTFDGRTDEFRHMTGGENEPHEANPMLGMHGIRRDIEEAGLFKSEISVISRLHSGGLKNIAVMLPFVISAEEVRKAKKIAQEVGIPDSVRLGVMIETPAAALSIEEICKEGIKFISFGSNDLTQLTLGIDRNNDKLIKLFDEMHPAMLYQFRHVIEVCKKYGVETSICGEAPSNRQDIIKFLVAAGIDSISVNVDALDAARLTVARAERALELERIRSRIRTGKPLSYSKRSS